MGNLSTNWNEISKLLREARNCLTPERSDQDISPIPVGLLTGTLDEFEEFLGHSELELAWNALAEVAERVHAPPACWHKLAQAAGLMQIPAKEGAALQHVALQVSCDQALHIARLDAEKAYRDLSGFRIETSLESDGWHIDYALKNPRLNGGGPHYVIDAMTGAILSKRYEQ